MGLVHRLSALLLCLSLIAGNAAICAGWAATPEARMACCADDQCPMHKGRSHESDSQPVVTQAQADACCAASERGQSNSSNPTAALEIPAAVPSVTAILPPTTPALVLTDGWRTDAPIHSPPVPRYVLLSVFLV